MSKIDDEFFYSLFQNKILKKFEIRIFFIFDSFFPLALFYDNDIDDYRANYDKIECMSPINLPNEILEKLKHFTKKNNFTTGSIDMMFADNEYYFLEINPSGQFGFVSNIYNTSLEKEIIDSLLN
jgi:glutathione synthase/RimK-type ligase-like ATP-grasp enzyme